MEIYKKYIVLKKLDDDLKKVCVEDIFHVDRL